MNTAPVLSVIVAAYNMRRETPRTLHTLSPAYQEVPVSDYEVIVVDNGSTQPLDEAEVRSFGPNFRYVFQDTDSKTPVPAINEQIRACRGDAVMVLIDAAHMLTPGVLGLTLRSFRAFDDPFVTVVGLHLGEEIQNKAVSKGYDQAREDALLGSIPWRENGYSLFRAGRAFSYDCAGWFSQLIESNCFAMRKESYLARGGLDESFQEAGGGLCILDFFRRMLLDQALDYVLLLGEGTFHQFHGGVASNASYEVHPWKRFDEEYRALRGEPYRPVVRRPLFFGGIPPEAEELHRICAQVGLAWGGRELPEDPMTYFTIMAWGLNKARALQAEDLSDSCADRLQKLLGEHVLVQGEVETLRQQVQNWRAAAQELEQKHQSRQPESEQPDEEQHGVWRRIWKGLGRGSKG